MLWTLVGAALVTAGCGMPAPGATATGSPNVLTAEQMIEVSATTVYDGVQKLRPSWLTSRGPVSVTDSSPTVASVFMNGNEVGNIEYLRNLRPDDIDEVRYYEPGEAGARFGMGHQRGVIDVVPKGARR
jgi:hypothetical protein